MATYDPFAVANKKKVRRGPDGLPIMEADAMKRPPIGQYGIASTPFPITGQPARPMAVDTPPPVKPSLAATRTPEAPFERVASNDYAPDHGLLGPPPPPIQTPGRAQAAPPAPGPMAVDGPPPLPFNSARAPDRARALTMRTLHSGPGGLDPTKEARIAQIYGAQDQRDAYARANRPLQTVQSPSEIQNRHSELGRNLVSGFRTELEGLDQQINAVQNEPLSEDKQRRLDVLVAQRANKAAQLDKAVNDPYWQQTSPARAGEIQAGQQRLRDRQMSDRTSGAADVAAYQGRQQYDRNLEDTMRQRSMAEALAAIKANEAESVARGQMAGRQGLGTATDQIVAQDAEAQAAHAAEINKLTRPGELEAAKVDAEKRQHPEWQAATQGILSGIKTASGKMLNSDTKAAYEGMVNAFTTFQSLPPELQRSAAASIMSELAADGLDIPKEAFADDRFNNVVSWLMDNTSPLGLGASALGYGSRKPTETAQDTINSVLKLLRTAQSSP